MHNFKKLCVASISFLLIFFLLFALITEPFFASEYEYYEDSKLRSQLAGSLDYLFVGASGGLCAFVPQVADEEMHVKSYNLSNGMMTWYGRHLFLEKEIARNPIKTVAIEISYNAFSREYHDPWGDNIALCRMDSAKERYSYIFKHVSLADLDSISAAILGSSVGYIICRIQNLIHQYIPAVPSCPEKNVDYASKGFHDKTSEGKSQMHTTLEKVLEWNRTATDIDATIRKKNLDELKAIVKMCQGKGIKVYLVVVPISNQLIFQNTNWDVLREKWQEIAVELDCELVDFNLLKNRYELFTDEDSFFDTVHMTGVGAKEFTHEYSTLMKQIEQGLNISGAFFANYQEMKDASPWASYIHAN